MKHIKAFESFINEGLIDEKSFSKFQTYIESLIPSNKRIAFFVKDHRLMVGYFTAYASMADLSKSLPEKVKNEIKKKFAGTPFTFMDEVVELDPISGKNMIFSAVSAKTQKDLQQIENLF